MFSRVRPLSILNARTRPTPNTLLFRSFHPTHQNTQPQERIYAGERSSTTQLLGLGKLVTKGTFYGLLAIGVSAFGIYIGKHLWVEHFCFVPEPDEEARTWEWHFDSGDWTGDPLARGTDPALTLAARRMIHAAWMVKYWGEGYALKKYSDMDVDHLDNIKFSDPQLQTMDEYLQYAIAQIDENHLVPSRPYTISNLLFLRGSVLEGLGDLPKAKEVYQRAWGALPAHDLSGARVAEKLGNVLSRVGDANDALLWWTRAIQLIQHTPLSEDLNVLPEVPRQAPSSPFAQRVLADVLVSLSSHYARNRELRRAAYVEDASLKLLHSMRSPDSNSATSTFNDLHRLYLVQRASILSVHLAEVEYILHKSPARSIQHLKSAAEASEHVARILMNRGKDFKSTYPEKLPGDGQLSPNFAVSPFLNKVANNLLQDARRTTAEAWNLMGVLHENKEGLKSKAAFECYQKAVLWGGTPSQTPDGSGVAAEHTLQREWDAYWGNYQRTKRAIESPETQR